MPENVRGGSAVAVGANTSSNSTGGGGGHSSGGGGHHHGGRRGASSGQHSSRPAAASSSRGPIHHGYGEGRGQQHYPPKGVFYKPVRSK